MESKRQFILDTLLPYKENPKTCATEGDFCKYLTTDGRKCAFGKHMKEGPWQHITGNIATLLGTYPLEQILTTEAYEQKLSNKEWLCIQEYHDGLAYGENLKLLTNRLERATGLMFGELR